MKQRDSIFNPLLLGFFLLVHPVAFWAQAAASGDPLPQSELARGKPWLSSASGPKKWKTVWVDAQGGPGDSLTFETQQNWVWPSNSVEPLLETVIQLPNGFAITSIAPAVQVEGLASRRVSFLRPWSDAPISIQVLSPQNQQRSYSLMQVPSDLSDGGWVHSSCHENDLSLEALSPGPARLLAVRCEWEKGAVILQVFFDMDLELAGHTGGLALGPKQNGLKLKYALPTSGAPLPASLGLLEFKSANGKMQRHTLLWKANQFRRWGFSASTAMGYLNYAEPGNSIVVGQGVWVLRGQFDFTFVRQRLDASLGSTFVLLPVALGVTPARTPAGRFLGVWGNFGYWLPLPLEAVRFRLAAGYQYRMSIVENNAYGFRYYGPLLSLGVASARTGKGAFFGTFRYTPVASGIAGFTPGNYEFALQGGYAVATVGQAQFPIWVLLDFDVARGASADQIDVIQTWGLTAGVGVSF